MSELFKDMPVKLLTSCLARWAMAIVTITVAGYTAYDDVRDMAADNRSAIVDHSRELDKIKERQRSLIIQLADGSNAAQARTNERVRAMESFVEQQRTFNATVTEQNRHTKESVDNIENDMKGMRNELGTMNGNVRAILEELRNRQR